jgi:quinolinate synthase
MNSLPEFYLSASDNEMAGKISGHKSKYGSRLLILAHHYQRAEIVAFGDHVGDSYGLSKLAANTEHAEYIVFCGVRFMAEAARTLCRETQHVFLPNLEAGCPMADMAPLDQVEEAWRQLEYICGAGNLIPISYMNSTSELKAFTGKHGGLICTSSNAVKAFKWVFAKGKRVFFFPDQHLGRNTANKMGIGEIALYNPDEIDGGLSKPQLLNARIILWNGYCYVHAKFRKEHVDAWRAKDKSIKVVVHPECNEDVVNIADAVGSTAFIVDYVKNAPGGSLIAIGTELNLVHRLSIQFPDKHIFELSGDSCPLCSNMFRTSLADLSFTLDNLETLEPISIPSNIKFHAREALERMLQIGS